MTTINRSLLWFIGMLAAIACNSILVLGAAAFVLISWSIGTEWTLILIGLLALAWMISTWDDRKEVFRFSTGSGPDWFTSLFLLALCVAGTLAAYLAWGDEHPVRVAQIGIVAVGLGLLSLAITVREHVALRARQLYYL